VERRVILAIVLMLIVAVLPSILFPPKRPVRPAGGAPPEDTGTAARSPTPPPAARPSRPVLGGPTIAARSPAETVWVTTPLYRLGFSTLGAQLIAIELASYQSFAPSDSGRPAQLVPPGRGLLGSELIVGADTVSLATVTFTPSARSLRVSGDSATLRFTAAGRGAQAELDYVFSPREYRFRVRGAVQGLGPEGAVLRVSLGDGLRSVEADPPTDYREYAIVTKAAKTEKRGFAALKPGQQQVLDGPFEWVGVKSKYFLVAALAFDEHQLFGGALADGEARDSAPEASMFFGTKVTPVADRAAVAFTLPLPSAGRFGYSVYAGPLEHRRMAALGHDLDDANPYGGFLRPLIQPVAVLVTNVLAWMHEQLNIAYGWVLIIFGVMVRVLLWPLNQKALESSIRMQAIAPLIKQLQERYKNEPERLQRETMRLYREHHVNPLGGCLPMLVPIPVLFALFFVFQNTIELRGTPFLWLPDLSRADPYYLLPVALGLTMFAGSKVSQIGVPPNPQTTTMLYFMPAFMTLLFLRFASGLNLYYAVQNIVSLPQQYMIAMRRLKEQGRPKPSGGT
jgi:YidC/Oxa1 family membrane protein insertase